jgi:hypothetical protein
MPSVILVASYPPREYKDKSDSHEIAAAVKALAGAIFQRKWDLVFGAHPAISPLVLMIAREYGVKHRVIIYQSTYFEHHVSPAVRTLTDEGYGLLEPVLHHPSELPPGPEEPVNPTQCPKSLASMRNRMMAHPGVSGLVLIGGDTGLRLELELFAARPERLPIIPIGAPGGIARELWPARWMPGMDDALSEEVRSSPNYLTLMTRLVKYLAERT